MPYRLELRLRDAPGALQRVLGLAEHRGFAAARIAAELAGEGWRVQLVGDSRRSVETLRLQLLRLYDCLEAEVHSCRPADGARPA